MDVSKLVEAIREEIAFADQRKLLTGEQKRNQVINRIIDRIDELHHWPNTPAGRIAEVADGPAAKAVLPPFIAVIIHLVRESMKKDKVIADAKEAAKEAKADLKEVLADAEPLVPLPEGKKGGKRK